jgi:hypothetical protein
MDLVNITKSWKKEINTDLLTRWPYMWLLNLKSPSEFIAQEIGYNLIIYVHTRGVHVDELR